MNWNHSVIKLQITVFLWFHNWPQACRVLARLDMQAFVVWILRRLSMSGGQGKPSVSALSRTLVRTWRNKAGMRSLQLKQSIRWPLLYRGVTLAQEGCVTSRQREYLLDIGMEHSPVETDETGIFSVTSVCVWQTMLQPSLTLHWKLHTRSDTVGVQRRINSSI